MVLIFIFLMIRNVEHLFKYLLAIHVSSLEKCLFKPFVHFLNGLFALSLQIWRVLVILTINLLSDMWFANIFFHSKVAFSFYHLFPFLCISFLVWYDPTCLFLFLLTVLLLPYSRTHCQEQWWGVLPLCFLLGIL